MLLVSVLGPKQERRTPSGYEGAKEADGLFNQHAVMRLASPLIERAATPHTPSLPVGDPCEPRSKQGGVDAGDHPPITPVEPATEEELGGGDAWRLYDFCARWFLASVSPDCVVRSARTMRTGRD